jgi:polyferredoxin
MHRVNDALKKIAQQDNQVYRKIAQYLFLATILWIGAKFTIFVNQLETGMLPTVSRPPGVEAFLPISSLISLKYWLVSGVFNRIHPSGLVILLIILGTALLLKRGFCSWVCPFGLLTEYFNRIHHFIFKKDIKAPRWLDYPLRSLKYLLLSYFLWAILVKMNAFSLQVFIYGPYNRVADIKMLHFFSNISRLALFTLLSLLILSVLMRNFWCRYLCPYGALLGALSLFSIFKIHRNEATCTGCKKCTKTCPDAKSAQKLAL